jgi:Zn-dependent protease
VIRFDDPTRLVYRLIALLIAATIHEFAHAWMADRLGDPTPRHQGRLSLNPVVHLDLVGSLLLLLFGFGWAKPVQVNARNFEDPRKGMLLVAAAGPLANITMLFLIGLLPQLGVLPLSGVTAGLLREVLVINAILAVFNLIPIPPLDGSRILAGLLPPAQAIAYERLQQFGPLPLLLLIMMPGLLGGIINPAIVWLITAALGGGS